MDTRANKREKLRQKGQFWTPDWVADAMIAYVLRRAGQTVFDPAVGAGAFIQAAQRHAAVSHWHFSFAGYEIDPNVLEQTLRFGSPMLDVSQITLNDFIHNPPDAVFDAIIGNPPYIRHHRLSPEVKNYLRSLSLRAMGFALDGRAGLHHYFLLLALQRLTPQGKLAFIMPADTCEGVSAKPFWQWITQHYALEAVLTFEADASPFQAIDTNPIIFFVSNEAPNSKFVWARCHQSTPSDLKTWIQSGFRYTPSTLVSIQREIVEGITTGLSRPPNHYAAETCLPLYHFARTMRGIATGDNHYFFLTETQIYQHHLSKEFFRRAVGRTRDVPFDVLDEPHLTQLDQKGRPTYLLYLDGQDKTNYPQTIQDYLHLGEILHLPEKALIAQRQPWYKMETRTPPPFLFAYLGRRHARFIRNQAEVLPLSSFLCVYPRQSDPEFLERLWRVLQHPKTLANLPRVGKSYGSNAIKVEPRALEQLPIPIEVIEAVGLSEPVQQLQLF